MAVDAPRSGLTLWIGWVAAAALGGALTASATVPVDGSEWLLRESGAWYPLVPLVLALPVALLQSIVLRATLRFPPVVAGAWIVVSLAAAGANELAVNAWYMQAVPRLVPMASLDQQVSIFSAGDHIYPILLGIAQGVVFAAVVGRKSPVLVWAVVNIAADFMSLYAMRIAQSGPAPAPSLMSWMLPRAAEAALYAAITGAALVAMWRGAVASTAPAPAAR